MRGVTRCARAFDARRIGMSPPTTPTEGLDEFEPCRKQFVPIEVKSVLPRYAQQVNAYSFFGYGAHLIQSEFEAEFLSSVRCVFFGKIQFFSMPCTDIKRVLELTGIAVTLPNMKDWLASLTSDNLAAAKKAADHDGERGRKGRGCSRLLSVSRSVFLRRILLIAA